MSKLDKNQRVTTDKSQNTFDLSHDYLFTATTGQLRPVSHDLLQAGDKVRCKFDFFVRTMPIATPAMVDVDFFVDYFFVPLELLWLPFGSVWSQTKSFPFYNDTDWPTQDPGLPGTSLPTISTEAFGNTYLSGVPAFTGNINLEQKAYNSIYADYDMIRLMSDLGFEGAIYDDAAGYVAMAIPSGGGSIEHTHQRFFPWQFCAYQCIYQHFYRDEEREQFNSDTYSIPAQGLSISYFLGDYCKLRYLNRQDDYFTASKLSPLVANLNNNPYFFGGSSQSFNLDLGANYFVFGTSPDISISNTTPLNLTNEGEADVIDSNAFSSRSVNQLRALFAQEKLLHVMNMTAKNYDAQVLARLGYDVPKDIKHQVQHLGHEVVTLDIQEIVSGSNTFNASTGSGSALGDLAGQGKAITRNFKGVNNFTAPCHGVLMSIFSCRTRPKYTTSALRKDLIKDITDFFTPELDDLGMQPLYRYETTLTNEFYADFTASGTDATFRLMNPFVITGWNYRYEYLKRNINRASLAFMNSDDNLNFVTAGDDGNTFIHGFNSYQQWSRVVNPLPAAFKSTSTGSHAAEDDYYTRPHYDLYKVSPHEMDSMMLLKWLEKPSSVIDSGSTVATENWLAFPWLMYQRDPFIIDGHFSCLKRSHMSVYSMPKLV